MAFSRKHLVGFMILLTGMLIGVLVGQRSNPSGHPDHLPPLGAPDQPSDSYGKPVSLAPPANMRVDVADETTGDAADDPPPDDSPRPLRRLTGIPTLSELESNPWFNADGKKLTAADKEHVEALLAEAEREYRDIMARLDAASAEHIQDLIDAGQYEIVQPGVPFSASKKGHDVSNLRGSGDGESIGVSYSYEDAPHVNAIWMERQTFLDQQADILFSYLQ